MILNEGLPKPDPKTVIEELRHFLYQDDDLETFHRFFPEEREKRYRANFKLFDRDGDNFINLNELKELLASIGQTFADEELEELFHELEQTPNKGIFEDQLFILVSKKIKDADKEAQLLEAFKIAKKSDKEENEEILNCENFKELLMSMGNRWTEEKADEFLKEFDPKNEGKFKYEEVVKRMMKK